MWVFKYLRVCVWQCESYTRRTLLDGAATACTHSVGYGATANALLALLPINHVDARGGGRAERQQQRDVAGALRQGGFRLVVLVRLQPCHAIFVAEKVEPQVGHVVARVDGDAVHGAERDVQQL